MKIRPGNRAILALAAAGGLLLAAASCREEPQEEIIPLGLDEALIRKTISRLGNGFLVWERHRNNNWEIWVKPLSGGKEKRMVPAEHGRDHFCPKVSPDGRFLAYMSYPKGTTPYPRHAGTPGTLWLMQLSSRKRRLVAAQARSYAEDRAVTWLDNERLCFIDGEGFTNEFNVVTRASRRLINQPHADFGYLVSPDLKHATSGTPEFAIYDAGLGLIRHQQRMAGCQPYFTQDGVWGYWMGGAGGPINRMRLTTREIDPVLQKNDRRLHGKRNYVYFPMVSPCQRLIAFAASPDNHDHFAADYDIYVAHLHPGHFEIIGLPLRYTKFPGCDRFPDVFRRELPLGTHYVEGETELALRVPSTFNGQNWDWHITGKVQGNGRTVNHRFRKPGEYWLEARRGDAKLRGYVHVSEPRPPTVKGVRRHGRSGILIDFSEPVSQDGARITLADGTAVPAWKLVNDSFAAEVSLPGDTPENAEIHLHDFRDKAQAPNRMHRATVTVPSTTWPASDEGMVFVWEYQKGRTTLPDGTPCELNPHGLAYFDEHGAMKLRGGWFDAPGAGELVSDACRRSHEITVEMIITSQPLNRGQEFQRIISLANRDDLRNLAIGQIGNRLALRLRTPETGPEGNSEETQLAQIEDHQPHHLVIAYKPGRLGVWVDGMEVLNRHRFRGDFSTWEQMKLRFGASAEGNDPWRGSIDRVVIYNRSLTDAEIAQHSNSSIVAESKRDPPREWKVKARLVEASPLPSLEEFQPYTEALVRHLYEIVEAADGPVPPGGRIAVSHWTFLDAKSLPAHALRQGDLVTLRLHREEDHPELRSLFIKDELIEGLTAERFHDAADWDVPLERSPGS